MTHPRPDQMYGPGSLSAPGSRSGAGDTAAALTYPGIPSAVPNLQGATLFQQHVEDKQITGFPSPGRIWAVLLAYSITTDAAYSGGTNQVVAQVYLQTGGINLTLAVVQLSLSAANGHDSGNMPAFYPGVPAPLGASARLNVNNGTVIPDLFQQASVSVLFSIP